MPATTRHGFGRTVTLTGVALAALLSFPISAGADVTSSVSPAGVLNATGTGAEEIRIACEGTAVRVNAADPGSGPALCADIKGITVTGGPGANAINLTGVTAAAFTGVTAVTVEGGAGADTIAGSEKVDTLSGGDGNDRILGDDNAPGTRDVFRGDAGDDTLVWNPGDDDDTMDGGDGADTIEVNGGGGGEQFTAKPSATPGRVSFDRTGPTPPGPFNLDIGTSERLDLNAAGGDDAFVADDGLAGAGIGLDIDGGDGNDTLDGGDGADLLAGGAGNDRLIGDDNAPGTRDVHRGDAGDDTLVWNPGDDDDTMDGGDGADTIEVNGGGGGEQFTAKPSATPGRVSFDRTGPTPPGPFNLDIGTSERLDLNAAGGDDTFIPANGLAALGMAVDADGGDGNDNLRGGDGADVITGGAGIDVILSRDGAADTVDCGAGFDLARVDRRDTIRNCDIVTGGARRARLTRASVDVQGKVAPLRVRCVATSDCRVRVELRAGSRRVGIASARIGEGRTRTVKVRLNARGRRLVARAPRRGARVTARMDVRDRLGNGWRTSATVRLR